MSINTDDLEQVLQHIIPKVAAHKNNREQNQSIGPFLLCLSGLQGSGKTTWASHIARSLQSKGSFKVLVISLDDLYHDHDNLVRIKESDLSNKLLRTRGQPGTHDELLAQSFFASLKTGDHVMVPSFDKSRFNGEGDRVPIDQWERVTGNPPIDVVIFEGWSVGFQWLDGPELEKKWRRAKEANVSDDENERKGFSINTLRNHPIAHLRVINENLRRYNKTFMNPDSFNYLVHLDTNNLANVYYWRMDQEHALKKVKGTGMTDDMVVQFVQGYMPAYELYLEKLQKEPFIPKTGQEDTQLRVVLNSDRKVISISTL